MAGSATANSHFRQNVSVKFVQVLLWFGKISWFVKGIKLLSLSFFLENSKWFVKIIQYFLSSHRKCTFHRHGPKINVNIIWQEFFPLFVKKVGTPITTLMKTTQIPPNKWTRRNSMCRLSCSSSKNTQCSCKNN